MSEHNYWTRMRWATAALVSIVGAITLMAVSTSASAADMPAAANGDNLDSPPRFAVLGPAAPCDVLNAREVRSQVMPAPRTPHTPVALSAGGDCVYWYYKCVIFHVQPGPVQICWWESYTGPCSGGAYV